MLETILTHLNNWFSVDKIHGEFKIENGSITLHFLKDGQYFRIMGSVFNDGLHQYPATDLTDETFDGSIWSLAVPKSVISLSEDIKAWNEKNQPSAYTSESFGGYSYSKAVGASGVPLQWQDVFSNRLSAYRKIKGVEVWH